MSAKWYIGECFAEGESVFFVELTDDEKKAVDKFVAAQKVRIGEHYSGSFSLRNEAFNTREEAIQYVRDPKGDYCFPEERWPS